MRQASLASAPDVPNPGQWSSDPYTISNYDAVTIAALAMLAAGTTDPAVFNPFIKTLTAGGSATVKFTPTLKGSRRCGSDTRSNS